MASFSLVEKHRAHQYFRLLLIVTASLLLGPISTCASGSGEFFQDTMKRKSSDLSTEDGNNEYRPPIIGVLTEVLRDYKRFTNERHLHIASSYVKWVETSGAQVLPILLNQDDAYYERVFSQTNGLLLPGGDNLLDPHKNTPMMVAAKKLYKLAVDANKRGDHYPIWGTCLGTYIC